ncbi:MAG: VWA domain-containing protein [Polyangiaceae bacterium]|jgi:Ca-activated chloride channel family protein|nr:VWA domain-containing protein [Polyangiaceae bacterium]
MPTASIDLSCSPASPALPAGQESSTFVLIRIRVGPAAAPTARPRLSAVLALDVSGSMQGQPLEHVVRSTERIVELLAPGDSVGIVSFASSAQVVAPLCPLDPASRRRLQTAVRGLVAEGGTNLQDGLRCAGSLFPPRAPGEQRIVLLLSDGQPNVGPSSPRELGAEAARLRADGSPVSTLGYGAHHDEKVLIHVAELGGGRYAFVGEPQLAEASFAQALGAQLDVALEGPRLVLTPAEDADIIRILGDYRTSIGADGLRVALRDLVAGEELKLVVEMRVRAWREGSWKMLYASLTGQEPGGGGVHHGQTHAAVEVGGARSVDGAVEAEVQVALADEQRTRARGLADRGDFAGAAALLRGVLRSLEQTPGFRRSSGDRMDDAYDALLDDVTVYEQRPDAERYAHYTKAQQDYLSLSKGGASLTSMSPSAQSMTAKLQQGGARGRVLVVVGPGRGASREVRGRLVIGRGVSCDLAIPSPSLSRQHAVIEQVGGQFWLVDLGSTNGIEVKGARVQRHLLAHGDQFSVVDTTFRFEQT